MVSGRLNEFTRRMYREPQARGRSPANALARPSRSRSIPPQMPARSVRLVRPEDLLRLVSVADTQISPDGHQVAFVHKSVGAKNARETALWIASAIGAARARALTEGPRDSMPRWSPDGASIAFVRAKAKTTPQIMLARMPAWNSGRGGRRSSARNRTLPGARALTRLPEGSISALEWSPDGTRLAFKWRETLEQFTKAAADARKKSGASTPPLVVEDPWYRLDGDGYFGAARYRLYVLEVRGARAPRAVFASTSVDDFSFDWSPDGRTIAVVANRDPRALFHPERTGIHLVDPGGRAPSREITGLPAGPKDMPRWSPDGTRLAWAGRRGRTTMYDAANVELWTAEITGALRGAGRPRARRVRSLTHSNDHCLMVGTLSDTADASFAPWFRWSADGESLLLRVGWHGAGRVASVSARGGAIEVHTDGSADLMPLSMSTDGHRVACIRSSPTEPPEVAVVEVSGHAFDVSRRTALNASYLRSRRLVDAKETWVRSGSARVHAWVMHPPSGAPDRRGAAILQVHGGPHAQYGVAFFHEFQVLAAAGYTVVFSNPRGSKGYGARFCGAIRGAWGGNDWKDVQSVTSFMRRLPGVDPRRLAIAGGSYGGYMTNWAIAHSRAYRAAVTDRCVSNLVSMCGSSDFPEVPDLYWPGVSWDRPEKIWRMSPIAHFRNVRTPTLIVHSEGDLRCNIEQAEQVHAALCAQGVPCRFVRYPKETSHGMSRVGPADLRLHRLHENLAWWARHLAD